jgi:hypothetical protein
LAEARAGIYRVYCSDQWQPKSLGFGYAYVTQGMKKGPILQMETDRMIQRPVCNKPFTIIFPDKSEWIDRFQPNTKGALIWFTYGSKISKGTGGWGVCFSLGQYTTVFQTEVYVIRACAVHNLDRNNRNRNIHILSVKLQLKHSTITRSTQNCNWPYVTEFN